MMVTLISPYSEISSLGIRAISAYLKSAGISTRLVFMPLQKTFSAKEQFGTYPDSVVEKLADMVMDDDLIGISVMSNYYLAIKDLTTKLKRHIDTPVVWGGVHPTVRPETSIQTADYICISEGEHSFLELCRRLSENRPTDDIPGIWSRKGEEISRTGPGEPVMDLSTMPPLDYDLEENYILHGGGFVKITRDNIAKFMGVTYWTYYTRGCPFHCSYCVNNALKKLNPHLSRLRSKTPKDMVDEIKSIRGRLPFIKYIYLSDDTVFALQSRKIAEFCEAYKREVGLPFVVSGLEPTVFTEEKFDMLVDAGMIRVRMGIQSGSSRVLDIYCRGRQSNELVKKVARSLQKYKDRIVMPAYDIILDNPWETEEDTLKTVELLSELTPPFTLNVFSLIFFPGTELYERAVREGYMSSGDEELASKHIHLKQPSYLNLLVALYGLFKVPAPLLRFLLARQRIKSQRVLNFAVNLVDRLTFYRRGFASLFKRDYSMFPVASQLLLCKFFPPRVRR